MKPFDLAQHHIRNVPGLLLFLAGLYAFHGCVALAVPAFGMVYIPFFAAASVLLILRRGMFRWPELGQGENVTIALVAAVLLGTTLSSIHVARNPWETTTLLVLIVATGYVFSSTTWFYCVLTCMGVGWLGLAWLTFPLPEFRHFSMAVLTALVVALVMHGGRVQMLRELQRLQYEATIHNRELSREIQRRQQTESALWESHRLLEARVQERTIELVTANQSLQDEIAQRREAEAEQRSLQSQLNHAHRLSLLGEASTALAHEIKQPLTVIRNFASACLRGIASGRLTNEEVLESLVAMRDEAVRGGDIVRHIRDFAIEPKYEHQTFDLNELVYDAVTLTKLYFQSKLDNVTWDLPQSVRLVASRVQILQVLTNLLRNAIEAQQACQRPDALVLIQVVVRKTEAIVSVVDSGPGVDPRDAHRIFEPYYTTKMDGLGMGLSICRTILQSHRGRIWIENNDHHGATFHVAIPFAGWESMG